MIRRLGPLLASLVTLGVLCGCAPDPDRPLDLQIRHVPLAPGAADAMTVGALTWRGGLAISQNGRPAFPDLRGMDVIDSGPRTDSFSAITKGRVWFEGEVRLDAKGALAGIGDVYRDEPDASNCAHMDLGEPQDLGWLDEDRVLITFDRGVVLGDLNCMNLAELGPVRPPDVVFHAVATAGPGEFYVAGAADGRIWRCGYGQEERTGCVLIRPAAPPRPADKGFELVSMDHMVGLKTLMTLWRRVRPDGGSDAIVATYDSGTTEGGGVTRVLAEFDRAQDIGQPEAITSQRRGKAYRLYMASNDSGPNPRRNLLIAFDWTPPGGEP